jgi:cytochrome oxidase Cu insertion factor (SCO1/SenC/PrrC family)
MKKLILLAVLAVSFAFTALGQGTPAASASKFKVGDMAPDFTLTDTAGVKVKLSDFRGKNNVVLAFYVFAFTGG